MNSRNPRGTPKRVPAVPVHRGPQAGAMGTAAHSSPQFHHAPNAALLIDFDNVTTGIRSDLGNELRTLLSSDIIKGKVAVQRAYADWRRYPQHMVPLAEASIDTIQATAYGTSKKNATDIRLAVDAIELVFTRPEIGTYILLSGDSDFSSLVLKLKEYGKYVIGVGIRESSSDLLVMNCDEYYSYNALTGLMKSGDEASPKHDPWELVSEAVTRMKRNGDVMRSDRLKQVMQEIDNTFDEKELHYSKFSRFVQEAVTRGVLSVTKLENGQLEVDLPRSREPVVEAPPKRAEREPEVARPRPPEREAEGEDEERARRGRHGRGRRGRGDRGRGDRPERAADQAAPQTVDAEVIDISDLPPAPPTSEPTADGRRMPEGDRDSGPHRVITDTIGVGGERLSRDEALALVRGAVESLTMGSEDVARASDVRIRAREILGRDSETLAERHFGRILRDAHDANVIDLRRRGDDFEVARAAEAAPVTEQLSRAEPAAPAPSPGPASPRGMGPRGGGAGRGRGSLGGARASAPPLNLLSIGVVDLGFEPPSRPAAVSPSEPEPAIPVDFPPPAEPAAAEERPAEAPEDEAAPAPRARRGRTPVKVRAVKKTASPTPVDTPAVKKKPRKSGSRKTASDDDK